MTRRLLLVAGLLLGTAALASASALVNPILAITDMPEPASAMLGAGALLVVLGLARRRQKQ